VFVRLSGCNLRCTWCDTPYTSWDPQGAQMPQGAVLHEVQRHGASHVVVTGGEPMLFDSVVELTREFKRLSLHITIETAGTVYQDVACDLMSISPKLGSSTPHDREGGRWVAQHERLRYQPDVLKRLMQGYEYQMKFVVTDPSDLEEIEKIIEETGADPSRIVLMPEGTSAEAIRERAAWLVEICKRERYRYSPRLHIDLWGNQRGR
jgi:7-carboxy-7-deazaguanine synthase